MQNRVSLFLAKNRWLKRPLLKMGLVPRRAQVRLPSRGVDLFVNARDLHGPSHHVMWGGEEGFNNYEAALKKFILDRIPDGDAVFMDVGANIGLISVFVALRKPGARIYSFEPDPFSADCLKATAEAAHLKNLKVVTAGVGEKPGTLTLYLNDKNAGGNSFKREIFTNDEGVSGFSEVPVVTLDDAVKSEGLSRIDVIKIDTQGFEEEVLKGAKQVISDFKPVVVLECCNSMGEKTDSLIRVIKTSFAHYHFSKPGWSESRPVTTLPEFIATETVSGHVQTDLLLFP